MPSRLSLLLLPLFLAFGLAHAADDGAVTVTKEGDAFIVDAKLSAPVTLKTAWEVLTDFEHMPSFLTNLKSSRITSRDGNTLVVAQEGVVWYGPFRIAFQSEREMRLEPLLRISSRVLSGTVKRGVSETRFSQAEPGQPVHIVYHSEFAPDSQLALIFGAPFVRHEIREQFGKAIAEMERREAH